MRAIAHSLKRLRTFSVLLTHHVSPPALAMLTSVTSTASSSRRASTPCAAAASASHPTTPGNVLQLPLRLLSKASKEALCTDCNPSRAMLLTGRYMHNVGIYSNGGSPSLDYALLPDRLKQASPGLRAVMIGKVRALESPRLVRSFCIAETKKAGVRSGIWAKPIAATPLPTEVLTTGQATMTGTRITSRTPSPPGSVPSRAVRRKPTRREGAGESARST